VGLGIFSDWVTAVAYDGVVLISMSVHGRILI